MENGTAGREVKRSSRDPAGGQGPFPLPREHGGWALLYGPFVVVTSILGSVDVRTFLLFLTLTLLFLAHEPMSRLVRMDQQADDSRKRYWWRWLGIYGFGCGLAGTLLTWRYQLWLLIPLGGLVLVSLAVRLVLIARRQEKSVLGELVGVAGLTSSVPIGYYIYVGLLEPSAWILWVLNVLYFSSAIFYVKMMVSRHVASRKEEAARRTRQCVLYHIGLLLAMAGMAWQGWFSPWLLIAFLPVSLRAFVGTSSGEGRLNLKKIGYTEVAHTVAFVLLFVVIWRSTQGG